MKKGLTEMVVILDRSGSMCGLEKDTIGGFNSMIKKQKKENGEAYVSLVLFDTTIDVIYDRVPIENVIPLTEDIYYTKGCTAMLDAVGSSVHHIKNIHKYARDEDRPEHTIFIITTDGMENASHQYSYDKVKNMIEEQRTKKFWEFIFLGANIDAASTAVSMGISADTAVDYCNDSEGTAILYDSINEAVSFKRKQETHSIKVCPSCGYEIEEESEFCICCGMMLNKENCCTIAAPSVKMSNSWRNKIDNDFKSRKLKKK